MNCSSHSNSAVWRRRFIKTSQIHASSPSSSWYSRPRHLHPPSSSRRTTSITTCSLKDIVEKHKERKLNTMDVIDRQQQIDIERLINHVQELQTKVERMECELAHSDNRNQERALALRTMLTASLDVDDDRKKGGDSQRIRAAIDGLISGTGEILPDFDSKEETRWDSYRNSFTLLMSKGYLQAVEQLRNRLMATEWELTGKPMAMQLGVAKFEAWCSANGSPLPYSLLTQLYENPENLSIVENEKLRSVARSIIMTTFAEEKRQCHAGCTLEAQKLSSQFSEGEFLSKMIPDPIEHGVVDSFRKMVIPMAKILGGGGGE